MSPRTIVDLATIALLLGGLVVAVVALRLARRIGTGSLSSGPIDPPEPARHGLQSEPWDLARLRHHVAAEDRTELRRTVADLARRAGIERTVYWDDVARTGELSRLLTEIEVAAGVDATTTRVVPAASATGQPAPPPPGDSPS